MTEEVQQDLTWTERAQELSTGEQLDFLKLEQGVHKIKILGDGRDRIVNFKRGEDLEATKMVYIDVEYKGEKKTWSVKKTITEASLYGQLVLYGEKKGTLVGETVTVRVIGKDMGKRYWVEEAQDLITTEQPPEEAVEDN